MVLRRRERQEHCREESLSLLTQKPTVRGTKRPLQSRELQKTVIGELGGTYRDPSEFAEASWPLLPFQQSDMRIPHWH